MKGLTLIEILLALSIFGIVMFVLYGAYTSNLEAIQIADENAKVNQTARIVLDLMRKDLQSAIAQTPGQPGSIPLGLTGKNEELRGRPVDRIDFTTLHRLSRASTAGAMDVCEIGYFVEEETEGDRLILYRREDITPDEDFTKGGKTEDLTRMIIALDITYEDGRGENHEEWKAQSTTTGTSLPAVIRIRLTLVDRLGREHLFMTGVHPELGQMSKGGEKK
jgi:prepilin-type N-terminal cleavage/methylation domain-containing protein